MLLIAVWVKMKVMVLIMLMLLDIDDCTDRDHVSTDVGYSVGCLGTNCDHGPCGVHHVDVFSINNGHGFHGYCVNCSHGLNGNHGTDDIVMITVHGHGAGLVADDGRNTDSSYTKDADHSHF